MSLPAALSAGSRLAGPSLTAGGSRLRSLFNPRFRSLLLLLAGIPLALEYVVHTLIGPLLHPGAPMDLGVYLQGARDLLAGHPYISYYAGGGWADPGLRGGYSYPPLLAWALQPLAHANLLALEVAATVAVQACLVIFLWTVFRALGVRNRQLACFLVLVAICFEPVRDNVYARQLNMVLLALTGIWFLGWARGDRWWAGAALGAAVALKLLQGPLLLLTAAGRRWRAAAAAIALACLLTAVAAPGYWGVFLSRVLGPISTGTGYADNQAPIAVLIRLLQPASLHGQTMPLPPIVRPLEITVAIVALAITLARIGRPRPDLEGRALEAAAMVAVTPFLVALQWPVHLVFLLLPVLVLTTIAVRRRHWVLLGAVLFAVFLIGVVHSAMIDAISLGFRNDALLEAWAAAGPAGIAILWLSCLHALPSHRPAAPAGEPSLLVPAITNA